MTLLSARAGVIALAVCAAFGMLRLTTRGAEPPAIEGVIEPVAIPLISPTGGKIAEVLVHRGERVKAGQLLVRFEANEMERRLEHLHGSLRAAPRRVVDATASILERLPAATVARLKRTDPTILGAEQEYTEALAMIERTPSANASVRLKRAEGRRKDAYERAGDFDPGRLPALRNFYSDSAELLRWLDVESESLEVRAPGDGWIELMDLRAGDSVTALSPVALFDRGDRFMVEARMGESESVKPGQRIEVVLARGGRVAAVVEQAEGHRMRASLTKPPITPLIGEKVRVLF